MTAINEFDFTLRFVGGVDDATPDEYVERLGEAGCTDALVGLGRAGRIALSFTREATSAERAVVSAIEDVRRAIPDATLTEAAPDLVGVTEVADLMGFSRQNMRRLMLACDAGVPTPAHEGRPSLWHLAKLLLWLRDERGYLVTDELLDLAGTTMQVNLVLDLGDADPAAQQENPRRTRLNRSPERPVPGSVREPSPSRGASPPRRARFLSDCGGSMEREDSSARGATRMFGGSHKQVLKRAQDAWDAGRHAESVSMLEDTLPGLHPAYSATDALIVATLATYVCDLGDPVRGLVLLHRVPLDGVRLTDVHLIALSARACCRAASGDIAGAIRDRETIQEAKPGHPSLALADAAIGRYGDSR